MRASDRIPITRREMYSEGLLHNGRVYPILDDTFVVFIDDPAQIPDVIERATKVAIMAQTQPKAAQIERIVSCPLLEELVMDCKYSVFTMADSAAFKQINTNLRKLTITCTTQFTSTETIGETVPSLDFIAYLTQLTHLEINFLDRMTPGPDVVVYVPLPPALVHLTVCGCLRGSVYFHPMGALQLTHFGVYESVRISPNCTLPDTILEVVDYAHLHVGSLCERISWLTRLQSLSVCEDLGYYYEVSSHMESLRTLDNVCLGAALEEASGFTAGSGCLGLSTIQIGVPIPHTLRPDGSIAIDMTRTSRKDGKLQYKPIDDENENNPLCAPYSELLQRLVTVNADTLETLKYDCDVNALSLDLSKATSLTKLSIHCRSADAPDRSDDDVIKECSAVNVYQQLQTAASRLTKLYITGIYLDGPEQWDILYTMTGLRSLRLMDTNIRQISYKITQLSSLRTLSTKRSMLDYVHPNIGYMTSLRKLTLSCNAAVIPYSICRIFPLLDHYESHRYNDERDVCVHAGSIYMTAFFGLADMAGLGSLGAVKDVILRGLCATGQCFCVDHFLARIGNNTRFSLLPLDVMSIICTYAVQWYAKRNLFRKCICKAMDGHVIRDKRILDRARKHEAIWVPIESGLVVLPDPKTGEPVYPDNICKMCNGEMPSALPKPLGADRPRRNGWMWF